MTMTPVWSLFVCLSVLFEGVTAETEFIHVREGYNVNLTCTSIPNLTVNWEYYSGVTVKTKIALNEFVLDSNYMPFKDRLSVVYTPTEGVYMLTLLFFRGETDSGSFRCYSSKEEIDKIVYVNLAEGPTTATITGYSSPVFADGTRSQTLTCAATAAPGVEFEWRKEGTIAGGSSSTLTLSPVQASDNGASIVCMAMNTEYNDIQASDSVTLTVYYGAKDARIQAPSGISEGDDITVICSCQSNPDPTFNITGPTLTSSNSRLEIKNISRTDGGEYKCTAGNRYSIETATTIVIVNYPPEVTVVYRNGTETDTEVTISCVAAGQPQLYYFSSWKHVAPDGHTAIRQLQGVHNKDQFTLTFPNSVSYEDNGYYECTVNNGIRGRFSHLHQTKLSGYFNVEGSPYIYEGDRYVIGQVGHHASLQVDFSSNPIYTQVTWFINDSDGQDIITVNLNNNFEKRIEIQTIVTEMYGVTVSISGYVAMLVIRNVTKIDFKRYHVVIVNEMGQSQTSVELTGKTEPYMPTKFSIETITATSVSVTWISGDNGGSSQVFIIQHRETSTDGSEQHWQENDVPEIPDTRIYTVQISDLIPNTKYDLRIYSRNKMGESDKTCNSIVKTEKPVNSRLQDDSIVGIVAGSVFGTILVIVVLVLGFLWKRDYLKFSWNNKKRTEDPSHIYQNSSFDAVVEDIANDGKGNVYQAIGPPENPSMHYQTIENINTTDRAETRDTVQDKTYVNASNDMHG